MQSEFPGGTFGGATTSTGLPDYSVIINFAEGDSRERVGGAPRAWETLPRPTDADVDKNIRWIKRLSRIDRKLALAVWINNVRKGGAWDYKRWGPYNKLGNFNYGATGRALGLPREVLLRAAGAVQKFDSWRAGESPGPGDPLGDPPYGDFPPSQEMIKRGMDYYDRAYLRKRLQ